MPIIRHHAAIEHCYRLRTHERAQRLPQSERIKIARQIEMRAHAERMNSGIGAPGGVKRDRLPRHCERSVLDRLLHRWPMRLALQAHERAAVEFEG